jgi:phospholipid/cholesterol/gamma-HCH transport system ATP-binding protein
LSLLDRPREAPPAASPARRSPITVRRLVSQFGAHRIHDGLDLTVNRGRGAGRGRAAPGTGKTVLLNTIIGLRRPTPARCGCSA